ncbi:hypothetical protein HDU97_000529 [Phlyctochytrium planicorne]|nr:hypothetical protein HDU97_000529 [Phlyctochytrium planicorne]
MFATRVLRQVVKLKSTTGIHGINVHPNPRPELISLYRKILHKVERFPESSILRKSVESTTKQRLAIVESETDVGAIESKIDNGQVEELIMQAQDEINLISKMEVFKPWEPLADPIPPGQWEHTVKV